MWTTVMIVGLISLIILIFLIGAPMRLMKFIGNYGVKLLIGILLLFFFNVFGGAIGMHIPINLFTVLVSGLLGFFGVISLAVLMFFFI